MESAVLWSWIAALSCVLCMGEVRCDCTEEGMNIEGGAYTLTQELKEGSRLVYHCPEGYYPYPAQARLCQASTWNPPPKTFSPQKCKVVECPDPNVLEHGSVLPLQRKYFVENETTYECYSGYRLRGSSKRVCLPNGKWSGSTPICSRDSGGDCPDPGIPPGASRTGNIFDIDDKVKYSCNNHLILVGSSERVCQENGQWTGIEPACYYKHTYDTSLEVAQEFGSEIRQTVAPPEPIGGSLRITRGPLNIYIAVDISQSIDKEYIKNATDAISQLIEKIRSFAVIPNYEILFFSSEVYEVVNILDSFEGEIEVSNIMSKLKNFERERANTRGTDLNLAFNTIFERMAVIKMRVGEEAFKEHRHVLMLFTDGGYNMGGSPAPTVEKIKNLVNSSAQQREEFLEINIFAAGAEISDNHLQPLATGGRQHYFRLKYIGNLLEIFDVTTDDSHLKTLCGLHKRDSYPWLASIQIANRYLGGIRQCLGSLVSPQFVLTAAHCFRFGDRPEDITVDIGNKEGKKVKTFFLHPEFNVRAKVSEGVKEFYDYDVALIQLDEEVEISDDARPICIPCTYETSAALWLAHNSTCAQQEQILLNMQNEKLGFLSKRRLKVDRKTAYAKLGNNRDDCIKHALKAPGMNTTNANVAVTDNFLCTGGRQPTISHVACKGDGGGAVFKNYLYRTIQVAVVTWGTKDLCGPDSTVVESDDDSRDFHINLFRVVPFLKSILGDYLQEYKPLAFLKS